jgi:hypothetical protein
MGVTVDERWNSQKVSNLIKDFNRTGVIPDKHPFFNRKIGKRKADINFGWTESELFELIKCENDVVYYAENFCRILTKKGRKLIKDVGGLRKYQKELLEMFQNNKFSIVLASRQIGKSITVAIYVSWYVLFHEDCNILLLSETGTKAKDLLKKIKEIQDYLPFYMQVGLVYDSTQRRIYDNGCTLISENTTENSGVSGSYEFVYWDEMALLDPKLQDQIFTGVFPTMSSFGDKAKFIITSTPRGRNNKFYRVWNGATSEPDSPDFIPFAYQKVMWNQVPEHDINWEREWRSIMGDEGFDREFNLSFDADGELLLDELNQKKFGNNYTKYIQYEDNEFLKRVLRLHPDFDIGWFADKDRKFHITIDIAGGKLRDYTVFNIFELKIKSLDEIREMEIINSELDFFKLEQVAILRNNQLKSEHMALYLYTFITEYMIVDNIKITIEMNFEGKFFLKNLFEYKGNANKLNYYRESIIVEYPRNMDFDNDNAIWEYGITQNANTKQDSCKTINYMVANNNIQINHSVTIDEGLSFGLNKKGKYQGLGKNDDCFMTVINIVNFHKTDDFEEQANDLYDSISDETKLIIENMLGVSEDDADSDDIY